MDLPDLSKGEYSVSIEFQIASEASTAKVG